MRFVTSAFSNRQLSLILAAVGVVLTGVFVQPWKVLAQRNNPPASLAQVGVASPLPVYVTNDPQPRLPDGFIPGSVWKFTTWTVPSTLTFTATVQKTEGGWAELNLSTDPPATSKWYYIPFMPGVWEKQ